ncbi:hypothetical protein CLOLEP_03260 [[Clostridium] leptum DSM 753]|uniref:Uncharacterized protein n=1 Tax=[Clostridium] leptum DSM 753 TaxID=428125 RepID=A7VXD6_9FIRM|nr:hypothetical protein CLOLEP_03260 [[Clostridium] leptum DSM 753]
MYNKKTSKTRRFGKNRLWKSENQITRNSSREKELFIFICCLTCYFRKKRVYFFHIMWNVGVVKG